MYTTQRRVEREKFMYTTPLDSAIDVNAQVALPRPRSLSYLPNNYQLKYNLPFALLLASVFRPLGVFDLDKNPCRRFCTLRDGLKVLRLCPRAAEEANERV